MKRGALRAALAHARVRANAMEAGGRVMRQIFGLLPALALVACASKPPEARPDAEQKQVGVVRAGYQSAFDGYRAFAEQDLADWRRANEQVGSAGGHAGQR